MVWPVCLDCHGLGFSFDSLADVDSAGRNFGGIPAVHVESIEFESFRGRFFSKGMIAMDLKVVREVSA